MPAHRTVIYKTFTQGKFLTWSWPVFSTSCPTSMSSKILSTFLRQVRAEIVHSCVGVLLHDLFQFGASSRFFEQSPNSNFITSCDPCLNCVDAPSIHLSHNCPMKCYDRYRLFSARVDVLSRSFFRSVKKGYKPCKCDPKPHSSGQWTFAVRNFEFEVRAKIHNIITTTNYSFCFDHTSHYTKVTKTIDSRWRRQKRNIISPR